MAHDIGDEAHRLFVSVYVSQQRLCSHIGPREVLVDLVVQYPVVDASVACLRVAVGQVVDGGGVCLDAVDAAHVGHGVWRLAAVFGVRHRGGVVLFAAVGVHEDDGGDHHAFFFAGLEGVVKPGHDAGIDVVGFAVVYVRLGAPAALLASHHGVDQDVECRGAEAQGFDVGADGVADAAYALLGLQDAGGGMAYLVDLVGIAGVRQQVVVGVGDGPP